MAVVAAEKAESKPIVYSVPGMSLSIVAGIPTAGKPNFVNAKAPLKVPSPPIAIKPSIPFSSITCTAFSWTDN